MAEKKYPFGRQFQGAILSLILRDPSFAIDYRDSLDPAFFEDPHQSTIASVAIKYLDRKGRPPELSVLQRELERYGKQYSADERDVKLLVKKATSAFTRPPQDEQYIREQALEFAQHQALKAGVRQAADLLHGIERGRKGSDYHEVRTLLERSLRIGMNGVHDLGISVGANTATVPKLIKTAYQKGATIPTGFDRLDKMMRGGLGRGEVGIIFGPPKRGKSTVLVNIGANAAWHGHMVVHYSFELRKVDVVLKYSCRASGMTDEQIMHLKDPRAIRKFQKNMGAWYGQGGPWVVYERPGQVGVEWIRSHLARLKSVHNVTPDLIIIDFMDRMKKSSDDLYQEGGKAMEKLTALGADFKCGVWTASQAGRQSEDKDTVRQSDASESWRKMADCDISISLNQTLQEKINGEITFFITGQRRGMDTRYIECGIDYPRSTIIERELRDRRRAKRNEDEKPEDEMDDFFSKKKKQRKGKKGRAKS